MNTLIDKILTEWAYRVNDGMPNPKNPLHIVQLKESMQWLQIPERVIDGFVNNLTEQKFYARSAPDKQVSVFQSKDSFEKHVKDKGYIPVPPEEAEKELEGGEETQEEPPQTEKTKIKSTPFKGEKDDEEETYPKPTDIYNNNEIGQLKQTADYEIKQLGLEHGYNKIKDIDGNIIFKPAPGNAGSMLNEIISGEVANILQENPNLSEEELMDTLMNQFGETKLFKQNKGSQRAGGIKKTEIPEGKNPGQYSKLLIAIRAGKRKHKKAMDAASKNNFENSQVKNYYGHKESFKSMINDIEGKEIIGPNGKPVSTEEAIELINSGGGGDNPSDTATLVFDSKSNKVIMLFHSDKDSTDAIIAQSSLRAEAKANEKNIDNLVEQGKITEEEGEQIKGAQIELIEEREKIENELKTVGAEPAKFFLDKVPMSEVVKSATSDEGPDGPDKSKTSTKVKSALNNKNLKSYLTSDNPTEE